MQTGERYAYVIILLLVLAAVDKRVFGKCVYDIGGCAVDAYFLRFFTAIQIADIALSNLLERLLQGGFPLPAWHMQMHRLICQVIYTWMYTPGAGVLAAERMEQA